MAPSSRPPPVWHVDLGRSRAPRQVATVAAWIRSPSTESMSRSTAAVHEFLAKADMRILTQCDLAPVHHGWERRRPVLVAGSRALAPDVVALQEVVDVPDLLGHGWHEVWHSRRDGDGAGAAVA